MAFPLDRGEICLKLPWLQGGLSLEPSPGKVAFNNLFGRIRRRGASVSELWFLIPISV